MASPGRAELVDWGLLGSGLALVATGIVGLLVGTRQGWWVIAIHGIVGLAFVPLLAVKLYRVRRRLPAAVRSRSVCLSVILTATTLAALATGIGWVFGFAPAVGPFAPLVVHGGLGVLVVGLLAIHLRSRFHAPNPPALQDRRVALRSGGLLVGGAVAWRSQSALNRIRGVAPRRFTGSREVGSGAGNRFPVTSWVADDPDPVSISDWRLVVDGHVDRAREFSAGDIGALDPNRERAILDCTSGWYSDHEWEGVRVGELLAETGVRAGARWVSFQSVTGYRWSLPLPAARDALLASKIDGERLSHGHGYPLRLVAPGRRGFQWVKWIERVEVRRSRDVSEMVAIFISGV